MTLTEIIEAVQKKLSLTVDGKAGPQTWAAVHLAVVGKKPATSLSLDAVVRAVQKKLGVSVDGNPGPGTWTAIHKQIVGKAPVSPPQEPPAPPVVEGGKADSRSEENIATLHERVRPYARALISKAASQGIIIKVISGMRTYAEQDALYEQGRSKPGKIVTNARGGYSNHNFGVAFDIGIFTGSSDPEKAKTYVSESPVYKAIGALGTDIGLDWGGNWTSPKDEPHFQLRPAWAAGLAERAMLTKLRERKAAGKDYYA